MSSQPARTVRKIRKLDLSRATIGDLLTSWELSMRARNLSEASVRTYTKHVRRFARWLAALEGDGASDVLADVTKQHIERYLADALTGGAAAKSVKSYHGALLVFCGWCQAEGEIAVNPVASVRAPIVPESPPPVISDDELRAMLRACEGGDFYARRDTALLRMMIDTGVRLMEATTLAVGDVNLKTAEVRVFGKFRRERIVVLGSKALQAVDRYVRVRERHPDARLPNLWLGRSGPLTDDGVYQVVKRRARQAGLSAHPHLLRHTFSHNFLAEGGQETSLMKLAGWQSREMLDRYGASLAAERARDEARKMQLGDRL